MLFFRFLSALTLLFSGMICAATEKISIIFNNDYKGTISLRIDGGIPCLTRPLLEEWDVNLFQFRAKAWN